MGLGFFPNRRHGHVFWRGVMVIFILFMVGVGPIWGQTRARNSTSSSRKKIVNIGALFTFNSVIGRAVKPAMVAALGGINSNSSILQGTTLNIIFHDTNCSGFMGTVEGNFCNLRIYI